MPIPISEDRQILLELNTALTADTDLVSAFGFDSGKRIYRMDNLNVSPSESPKLVITNWVTDEDCVTFGGRGGTTELEVRCAAVVYIRFNEADRDFHHEADKDLVTDLCGLLRKKIRGLNFLESASWYEIQIDYPGTQFDNTDTWIRGLITFTINARVTST